MNTASIGLGKVSAQMRACVAESVHEVLSDPDFGLELTEEAKRRLRAARKTSRRSYISLATLRKRLG